MMITVAALPAPHRPGRRVPQSRRLSEARRGAARVPARAGRPARGVPRAPTQPKEQQHDLFRRIHRARARGQQGRLSQARDRASRRCSRKSACAAWSRAGTATFPKARSPTSARRSTPSRTRRSSSPGSNIRSKQARDAANEKMMSDPRMEEMGTNMPFDGKRMIMGGFDAIVEEGSAGGGYTDGFVVPVPEGKRDAYRELAVQDGQGVPRAWRDPRRRGVRRRRPQGQGHRLLSRGEGRGRRKRRLLASSNGPTRQTRDEAWEKIMADESMQARRATCRSTASACSGAGSSKILDTASSSRRSRRPSPPDTPTRTFRNEEIEP